MIYVNEEKVRLTLSDEKESEIETPNQDKSAHTEMSCLSPLLTINIMLIVLNIKLYYNPHINLT